MIRVGVYIDYSNVYSGARDAFNLQSAPGYKGNVNPLHLGKRVALQAPDDAASPRRDTHELTHVKVFRGAPDPQKELRGAFMEAKRAHRWQQIGCVVHRHAIDYGQGMPVEKGVDVRIATTMLKDVFRREIDLVVLVSADKDFRHALLEIRDDGDVGVEVATWQAIPGGRSVGRIELRPERSSEPEVACHLLGRHDYGRLEDKIDYRAQPDPPGWRAGRPLM